MILLQCSAGVTVLADEESPYVVEYLDPDVGPPGPTWKPVMSHSSLQTFGNMRTFGQAKLQAQTISKMLDRVTRVKDKRTKEVVWP